MDLYNRKIIENENNMKTGEIGYDENLVICDCGKPPVIFWHYIKGIANHLSYFVKCDGCKTRTRFRKNVSGAIEDWNNNIKLYTYDAIKIEEGLCVDLDKNAMGCFLEDLKSIIFCFDIEIKKTSDSHWMIYFKKDHNLSEGNRNNMKIENYVILNQKQQKYWNEDREEWTNFLEASIYTKIGNNYYSPFYGEHSLPIGGEWSLANFN